MKCCLMLLFLLCCSHSSLAQVEIKHDAGTTVFTHTPKRIVALTWSQTEILLTLDTTPIGVATVSGYKKWQSNNPPLPESVTEVGHRGNPNLEAIAKLKPDLILGYNFRHENQYNRLNQIAPTLLYRQYPSANDEHFRYFEQLIRITRDLGTLLGKTPQAEATIAEMNRTIAQTKHNIKQAGFTGDSVLLGKFVGMGMGLRVFSNRSLSADIAQQLGLVNRWQHSLPGRDFSHIQLPQMLSLGNPHVIIFGDDSDETSLMKQSAIWPHLEFVQSKQLYRVENSWGFGGPLSATKMATRIGNALLKEGQP